jgi:hypothetical protein
MRALIDDLAFRILYLCETDKENGSPMSGHQIFPEHIRASLAQYSEHRNCTCLQCGYSGMMGVHRKERKYSRSKIIIAAVVVFGVLIMLELNREMKGSTEFLPWWAYALLGAGFAAFDMARSVYPARPNCNTELYFG